MKEIPSADVPIDLLLLADPSEEQVRSYLSKSKRFVVSSHGVVVGVCTVQPRKAGTYELMRIAVRPDYQRRGISAESMKCTAVIQADMRVSSSRRAAGKDSPRAQPLSATGSPSIGVRKRHRSYPGSAHR